MKNIYLVGFMGTGKTVVGKVLAKELSKEFIEIDACIEEREGSKIVDIFANKGEAYFRGLEKILLGEISQREDLVISCGGGLICDPDNLNQLKQTGVVFALRASVSTIYQRTKDHLHRPILNVDNPQERIEQLLKQRVVYYTQADHSIDTDNFSPEDIADKIIAILNHG
ncbi:MAG: shikimate kinase [Candidatus Susulua stagnicola]|nr:shikimate kinase [Candidatus Susulua stagnicola]